VVAATGSCVSAAGGGVFLSCSLGALASGASTTVSVKYTVPASVADGSVLTAMAQVSLPGDTNTTNDSGSDTTTVVARADVGVTLSDGQTLVGAGDGQTYEYTAVVVNNGPSDAQGVVLVQNWPTGGVIVAGTVTGCVSGVPLSCAIGTVAVGQTKEVKVQYTVPVGTLVGSFQSTASVTSATTDLTLSNNEATDTTAVGRADLVTQIGTGGYSPAATGTSVVLTVTVTNNGVVTARGVVGMLQGPGTADLTVGVATGCTSGSDASMCGLGDVLPGQSATFTVAATTGGSANPSVTVTSSATTTVPESDASNNGDTATLVIVATGSPSVDMARWRQWGQWSRWWQEVE
jgi:uncharacterized repeat protein (TIGR01451 family)